MSIDLSWPPLPDTLPKILLHHLNTHLKTSERPSFIGPVEITSLEFGDSPPDVDLIDMRDIYPDFLEDDEDGVEGEEDDTQKHTQQTAGTDTENDDDFEWVSRRAAQRHSLTAQSSFAYEHLPPHVSMGFGHSPATMDLWGAGPSSLPSLMDFSKSDRNQTSVRPPVPTSTDPEVPKSPDKPQEEPFNAIETEKSASPNPSPHPNLQMHFAVHWPSNMRLTLATSLLINYPSPGFMSLPIKLSVTGLVFEGEVVVAYEGDPETSGRKSKDTSSAGKRVHICIMDEMDPYAPAAKRPPPSPPTPPQDEIPEPILDDFSGAGMMMSMSSSYSASRYNTSNPPVGTRILPQIYIESEIGQADKHVLKNVTRVERFIQDAIRRTVQEELVWPNFWTGILGESDH